MITVLIPVLNESERIYEIVNLVKKSPLVKEVIVIDDGSTDETRQLAESAGATVIMSTLLGKGASLEDGVRIAESEIIMFLDGDLQNLDQDIVEKLCTPIINDESDFVKASFSRKSGRVTTLTAKPLLQTFFPELSHISQPLGGIVAGKKSILKRVDFETDYGVDVGLLLDSHYQGAKITQIDIGHIEHDSHDLDVLADMAKQVSRVIIDRASRYGRLHVAQLREVEEIEHHAHAELSVALNKLGEADKLALFDMDGTIIQGRFIKFLADHERKSSELERFLDSTSISDEERTRKIANVLAGTSRETVKKVAKSIPLTNNICETIISLRRIGYRVGIVTDSFYLPAEIIRRRVFADFCVAHILRYRAGVSTGEVTISPLMLHPNGCKAHTFCKSNVLLHIAHKLEIELQSVLYVGDGENDICALKLAGRSIAYNPKSRSVKKSAKRLIYNSMNDVLLYANDEVWEQTYWKSYFSNYHPSKIKGLLEKIRLKSEQN
ncbi:HAD-IB family phosphatase [bacterium]|nr:HAD-IB family phosphatase [bacterium]